MPRRLVLASVALVLGMAGGGCAGGAGTFGSTTLEPVSTTAGPTTTAVATTAVTTTTVGRTTAQVMVPAAAFIPGSNATQYYNNGSDVRAEGPLTFYAPLWFPVPVVRIEQLTLVGYDPNPDAQLCLRLYVGSPIANTEAEAGEICTGTGDTIPQIRTLTDLASREVDTATQAAYLYATFDGPDVFLGGVQVTYSY